MVKKFLSAALALVIAVSVTTGVTCVTQASQQDEAFLSVEAFSIGNGYVLEPEEIVINTGDTAAQAFDKALADKGITYEAYGNTKSGFYLKSINVANSDKIPDVLRTALGNNITSGTAGSLGEKDYTSFAGWMYTVNGNSPSVGMSDYILKAGDVLRVQFSLYWGADIGLANKMGMQDYGVSDYYPVADKEKATRVYAQTKQNVTESFKNAITQVNENTDNMQTELYNYLPLAYNGFVLGDADENGKLALKDAAYIQSYTSDAVQFSFVQLLKADYTKDNSVNLKDASAIQAALAQ